MLRRRLRGSQRRLAEGSQSCGGPEKGGALVSCLDATLTLTPQSPLYSDSSLYNFSYLYFNGADFSPFCPTDLPSLYASNRFLFDSQFAGDPSLDYSQWANLQKARFIESFFQLQFWGAGGSVNKQLVLIFGFDVPSSDPGRLLIYSPLGQVERP